VLEPEVFYLLLSAERVRIPPRFAAEMLAYDPTAGELCTHYAGFFDPGFGYSRERRALRSRRQIELPRPADDAEQALPRAAGRPPRRLTFALYGSLNLSKRQRYSPYTYEINAY
jgi:hypothetical protein